MKDTKIEKLRQIVSRNDISGNEKVEMLIIFTENYYSQKLPQSCVSDSSFKIILECLNSSLKYGEELMINSDEDNANLGLELLRKNEAISLAISEVENYR